MDNITVIMIPKIWKAGDRPNIIGVKQNPYNIDCDVILPRKSKHFGDELFCVALGRSLFKKIRNLNNMDNLMDAIVAAAKRS